MKTYDVTFVKACTVTVIVPDHCDEKDIEEQAYDKMIDQFINGDVYEPGWEMTECAEDKDSPYNEESE